MSEKEESNMNAEQEAQALQTPPKEAALKPVPPPPPTEVKYKTEIGNRLDEALKSAKPVNRSSDLVPLSRDYETMRKELKNLIASSKNYQSAMLQLQKARTDMVMRLSTLSTDTPLFDVIGNTENSGSLAAVTQDASKLTSKYAQDYQENIVGYTTEWAKVIETRIEKSLEDTQKLHERLNHYQTKIVPLRNKVKAMHSKGKEPSKSLTEKVDRNEKKLDQAWKAHERCASKLCNLLEEVTTHGWKDLYPLVKASMEWEIERASGEYDVLAQLPVAEEALDDSVEKTKTHPEVERRAVKVALEESDHESETTGSFHPDDELESSVEVFQDEPEPEIAYEIPASPKSSKAGGENAPNSPKHVLEQI